MLILANLCQYVLIYVMLQFVAHPNCQQLLAQLWYEGLPGFRRRHIIFKVQCCYLHKFWWVRSKLWNSVYINAEKLPSETCMICESLCKLIYPGLVFIQSFFTLNTQDMKFTSQKLSLTRVSFFSSRIRSWRCCTVMVCLCYCFRCCWQWWCACVTRSCPLSTSLLHILLLVALCAGRSSSSSATVHHIWHFFVSSLHMLHTNVHTSHEVLLMSVTRGSRYCWCQLY